MDTSPLVAAERNIVGGIESEAPVPRSPSAGQGASGAGSPATGARAGFDPNAAEPGDEGIGGSAGGLAAPVIDAAVSAPQGAVDAGGTAPMPDSADDLDVDAGVAQDEGGLLDSLGELIALDPRVREAAALRRLRDAISSDPPDVSEALDALDDVNCLQDARTCVSICVWAESNCRYCASDPLCAERLQERCRRTCP